MMKNEVKVLEFLLEQVKHILEKMLQEERVIYLEHHPETKGNGYYVRDLQLPCGQLEGLRVPRSRDGGFKSQLLPHRRRGVEETEELVRALIIAGLSTRKIGEVFKQLYGMPLSATTASRLARIAQEEITAWRQRPLSKRYAVILLDAIFVSLKRDRVEKEAVYVALAIREDGPREILGYWLPGGSESAADWREILQELRQRGVEEVEFIVADGLTGLKEVIAEVFPQARYQRCVVHMIRRSSHKVRARDREAFLGDLKGVYRAKDRDEAYQRFEELAQRWGRVYPRLIAAWRQALPELLAFMVLPFPIRAYVYSTNALERVNKELKRRLKSMEQFPNEISAEKYIYAILSEMNNSFLKRRLRNWEYYYNIYQEEKNLAKVHRSKQTQLT